MWMDCFAPFLMPSCVDKTLSSHKNSLFSGTNCDYLHIFYEFKLKFDLSVTTRRFQIKILFVKRYSRTNLKAKVFPTFYCDNKLRAHPQMNVFVNRICVRWFNAILEINLRRI
jgi:hypothetical protein